MKRHDIKLFTHSGCPGGERCITYFKEQGVPFVIKDVIKDEKARQEFQERKFIATPVIVIDNQVFIGFDRSEISDYLYSNHGGGN